MLLYALKGHSKSIGASDACEVNEPPKIPSRAKCKCNQVDLSGYEE